MFDCFNSFTLSLSLDILFFPWPILLVRLFMELFIWLTEFFYFQYFRYFRLMYFIQLLFCFLFEFVQEFTFTLWTFNTPLTFIPLNLLSRFSFNLLLLEDIIAHLVIFGGVILPLIFMYFEYFILLHWGSCILVRIRSSVGYFPQRFFHWKLWKLMCVLSQDTLTWLLIFA